MATKKRDSGWNAVKRRCVFIVELPTGEIVIRSLLNDIADIMCLPSNQKEYGKRWAFAVVTTDDDARQQWKAHKASGAQLLFAEVLPPPVYHAP